MVMAIFLNSKTPQLVIVFNDLDASLAYYIKSQIGYGNIYKVKNKKAVILVIANQLGLIKILALVNGKIRSKNKFNQIKNNILTNPKFSIYSSFSLNTYVNLNNHWLAGFSEASTATFEIQVITKSNQNQHFALASQWLGRPEVNKTLIPKNKALPETRIVVWGKILYSSVRLGRFTKEVSNMIGIPAYQQSVITGLMLSDG